MKKMVIIIMIVFGFIGNIIAEEFVFAVNKANTSSSISKTKLNRILQGKIKNWDNGSKIVLINLSSSNADIDALFKKVIGKTHSQMNDMWQKMQIQGKGAAPMTQPNSDGAKTIAGNIPGALIFIEKSKANGSVKELEIK